MRIKRSICVFLFCLSVIGVVNAQSHLIKQGFVVPETIAVGETKVWNVPAGADRDEIQTIINSAITSSSANHTTHIKFVAGAEYRIGNPSSNPIMTIAAVSGKKPTNIIFDGQGCQFVVTTRSRFCVLNNYSNVMFRNFELDWDPRFSSHGVVSEWDPSSCTCMITLKDGETPLDHPYYQAANLLWVTPMVRDLDGVRWRMLDKAPGITQFRVREKISDTKFKVWFWAQGSRPNNGQPSPLLHNMKNGMNMAFQARNDGRGAFYMTRGEKMMMRDVTILNSPAAIAGDKHADNNAYYNVRVNPGGKRIWGGNADGLYVVAHRNGPWIENCEFSTIADDAIVVKNNVGFLQSTDKSSKTPYTFRGLQGACDFLVGDSITIYDVSTRKLVSKHVVTASTFTFNENPVSINTEPAITIAPNDSNKWVYNMSNQCNGFVLKNTKFYDHRRWSVLCQAAYASIIGNDFIRNQTAAIQLTSAPDGGEGSETGGVPRHIEIRDNHIEGNWHTYAHCDPGVVIAQMKGNNAVTTDDEENDTKGDWNGIENIQIVNNTFKNWHMMGAITPFLSADHMVGFEVPAIYLRDVNNVVITGNTFENEGTIYEDIFKKDVDENNGDKIIRLVDCKNTANYGNNVANDVPAGVDDVEVDGGTLVLSKDGILHLKVKTPSLVNVYAVDGRMLRSLDLAVGVYTLEGLHQGVYVINGMKVII